MKTDNSYKWITIVLATTLAALAVLITQAARQPAQAKTDEQWIIPETISAGDFHTCGLKSDGTLACWGRNDSGQAAPPAGTFTQVSAGSYHTCGLKSSGWLRFTCWGANSQGQSRAYHLSFIPLLRKP